MRFDIYIEMAVQGGSRNFRLASRFSSETGRLVLLGPSGAGKSLTLQAIAGLMTPDAGRIRVDGRTLFDSEAGVDLPARQRRVGFVFQDYALFPHLSVRDNVGFGLSRWWRGLRGEAAERVDGMLDLFGLGAVSGSRPGEISGGQRQRAALARALVCEPHVLLLDEPFAALDQPLRQRMRGELSRILAQFAMPMILVTHDLHEVEEFAETVVVYHEGGVGGVYSADEMRQGEGDIQAAVHRELQAAYHLS